MSQKTESPNPAGPPDLSNSYLGSLVVGAVIVLALVFLGSSIAGNPLTSFRMRGSGPLPWMYPWILAAGQTIGNGLTEFSGNSLNPAEDSIYWASLMSIFLSGILAPTLTLRLMGRARAPILRGLYIVSLVMSTTFAIAVVPSGFKAYRARLAIREAQAIQGNKDEIINELSVIAKKVYEYRILPKVHGGGDGTTHGYALPTSLSSTHWATYKLTETPAGIGVLAASNLYQDAGVTVTIQPDGRLQGWTYVGLFQ